MYASIVSKASIKPVAPICAQASGIEVLARYTDNPAVAKAIAKGAHFDLAVIETHMLKDLSNRNLVAENSI